MATSYKSYLGSKDVKWWDGLTRTFARLTSTGGTLTQNKIGDYVDVLEVYGSGTDYNATTLILAINTLKSVSGAVLRLKPGTWTIDAAVTVPANLTLGVPHGAMITKSGSGTIAINGPFSAGLYQVFSGFSAGNVVFGAGSAREVCPEWFLVNTTPGTTDMITALNSASSAISATGGTVLLSNGYGISSTFIVPAKIRLKCIGGSTNLPATLPTAYIKKLSTMTTTGVSFTGDSAIMEGGGVVVASGATGDAIKILANNIKLFHVAVSGPGKATTSGDGIRIGQDATGINANSFYLDNPYVTGFSGIGIHIHDKTGGAPDANAGTIINPQVTTNGSDGIKLNNCYLNTVIGGLQEGNTGYGFWMGGAYNTVVGGDRETNTAGNGYVDSTSVQGNLLALNLNETWSDNSNTTKRPDRYIAKQGTWTPTVAGATTAGTQTYTYNSGRWYRDADYVMVEAAINMSALDAATDGHIVINGLPFAAVTAANAQFAITMSAVTNITLDVGYTQFAARVDSAAQRITLLQNGSGVAANIFTKANLANDTQIFLTGRYPISTF